ncbi:MAG: hypothetical protein KBT19_08450 [Lachnospiraceae bacterium]|nr:hypothetical protein [Candidatus Colinaster equi]
MTTGWQESEYWWGFENVWWTLNEQTGEFEFKEDTPERVKKSFELWENNGK